MEQHNYEGSTPGSLQGKMKRKKPRGDDLNPNIKMGKKANQGKDMKPGGESHLKCRGAKKQVDKACPPHHGQE